MSSPSTPLAAPQRAAAPEPQRQPPAVWVLTNAPSPYQAELMTAISQRDLVRPDVRFMRSSSTAGRAVRSTFASRTMWSPLPAGFRDEIRPHPRALWEAAFGSYDCYVLSGLYTSITFLGCAAILALRGKPWLLWMERPRGYRTPRFGLSLVRRCLDRVRVRLLRSASRVLCIGSAAQQAYAGMGIPVDKLDVLPYCCDLSRYNNISEQQIAAWRREHGLEGHTVLLFSGQLVHRKGVDTLLAAFERVAGDRNTIDLVLLGDGPLRSRLQEMVRPDLRSRVHFLGHLPQEQLPTVFCAADVFVFPSRHDGWAVVLNEACAARLPVIASQQTGAAHDLVEPGESGFRHDAEDTRAFAESMTLLANDKPLRQRMGERSRQLVEFCSPAQGAARFAQSVQTAIEQA